MTHDQPFIHHFPMGVTIGIRSEWFLTTTVFGVFREFIGIALSSGLHDFDESDTTFPFLFVEGISICDGRALIGM